MCLMSGVCCKLLNVGDHTPLSRCGSRGDCWSQVVKKTDPLLKMVPGPISAISKPVIPYMQKGEKTVGRTGLIAASISEPILGTCAAVALVTSPVPPVTYWNLEAWRIE